ILPFGEFERRVWSIALEFRNVGIRSAAGGRSARRIVGGYASAVRCEDILSRRHLCSLGANDGLCGQRDRLADDLRDHAQSLDAAGHARTRAIADAQGAWALLLILVVIATIVGIGAAVSGPAETWIAKLPEGISRIEERLRFLDAPINTLRTFLAAANSFGAAGPQQSSPGPFDGGAILSSVFAGTRSFASGLFTTALFLYFLLVSGDSFLVAGRGLAR